LEGLQWFGNKWLSAHPRIHHQENAFAWGKKHANGIDFFEMREVSYRKTSRSPDEKFLIHLKESEWRFNNRDDNVYFILLAQTRHFFLKTGQDTNFL
jgi:transposase